MFGNMAVIAKQHPIRILVWSSQGCWHWAELYVASEEMSDVGLSLMDVAGGNTPWVPCAFAG